jgi:hypothetical protein
MMNILHKSKEQISIMNDYPEQLELDLDIEYPEWDENTIYTEFHATIVYSRDLSPTERNAVWDLLFDTLQDEFPYELASGHTRHGTDKELYPEDYDESEQIN